MNTTENNSLKTATFGAGCFWCVEAVFQLLDGVEKVQSGYMGGQGKPTYKAVCTGTTGHAEVCNVTYNPEKITFEELLEVFFTTHNPTTLNQQGNDKGTQYRSAVFYHNAKEKELATFYKNKLNEEKAFPNPVVTEISEASEFFPAEDYHNNYYNENQNEGYCSFVIKPKVDKVKKIFAKKLKSNK